MFKGQGSLSAVKKFLFLQTDYLKDKKIFISLIFSLLINIFFWITVSSLTASSQGSIPLHYSIYFGVDLLGDRKEIFKLPFISLLFILINFILSFIIYKREKILSYFLVFSAFLIQIFLLGAALLIINL